MAGRLGMMLATLQDEDWGQHWRLWRLGTEGNIQVLVAGRLGSTLET